jgi:hypothetical protein
LASPTTVMARSRTKLARQNAPLGTPEARLYKLAAKTFGSTATRLFAMQNNVPLASQQELKSLTIAMARKPVKHARHLAKLVMLAARNRSAVRLRVRLLAQALHALQRNAPLEQPRDLVSPTIAQQRLLAKHAPHLAWRGTKRTVAFTLVINPMSSQAMSQIAGPRSASC